jgi:hypothetical protein
MRLPRIRSRDSTTADDDGPTIEDADAGSSSPVVDTAAAPTTDTTSAPSNGQQQPVAAAAVAADGSNTPSMIEAGQRQTAQGSAGDTPAAVVNTTTIPEMEDQHDVDLEAQEEEEREEGDDLVSRLGEADATIAQAWLAKRREQIQGGNGKSTAVDVDTLSRWFNNPANNNNHNVYPQSADYLSTRRVHGGQRISPYHHENDAESSLSSWSIRTDKTPVVSNRVPGALPRPLPRLTGAGGDGPVLPLPQASSPTPDQAVPDPPQQNPSTPVPPPPPPRPRARGQDLSCRDVFDYSKWHGKVRCCVGWLGCWMVGIACSSSRLEALLFHSIVFCCCC